MTATQAEQAVDRAQAELNAATKLWRDALIRESPIQPKCTVVGGRYNLGVDNAAVVKRVYWHSIHQELWADYGFPADDPLSELTRIDEHGNSPPPRVTAKNED